MVASEKNILIFPCCMLSGHRQKGNKLCKSSNLSRAPDLIVLLSGELVINLTGRMLPIILIGEMARPPNQPQLILRTDEATKRVRELAESSSNVIFTDHARAQGRARDISTEDVMRILRSGFISDAPIAEDGKWKVKVLFKLRGQRDAGVVALILWQGKLVIKTVEWEDWK